MIKIKLIFGLLILVLFIIGCEELDLSKLSDEELERITGKAIVCNEPYIRFGIGCCLDKNNNDVCDIDENEPLVSYVKIEDTKTKLSCVDECSSDFCKGFNFISCLIQEDGCKDEIDKGKIKGKCDVECLSDSDCKPTEECNDYGCISQEIQETQIQTQIEDSQVKKCAELCFESGGKISQALMDNCKNACEMTKYYGGESKIINLIESYEKSIAFEKDLANGIYDEIIKSCENKRENVINAILPFIKNMYPDAKREDAEPYAGVFFTCSNSDLKKWVLDGKKGIFGENFDDVAKEYKAKQELFIDCYSVMYEWLRLRWIVSGSNREDLKLYLEKDTKKECYIKISSSGWNEETKQSFIEETKSFRAKCVGNECDIN